LNFAYASTLKAFCAWYAASYRGRIINKRNVGGYLNSIAAVSPQPNEEQWMFVLRNCPPAPMIDKTWYVGKLACVGCEASAETETAQRCKRCGQAYCSVECHAANWQKQCSGCGKDKQ